MFYHEDLAENEYRKEDLELTAFLDRPTLLHVMPKNGYITGMTALDQEIYVVRGSAREVDVYNADNFILKRKLNIIGSKSLVAVVACVHNNCLYISDVGRHVIYHYDLRSNTLVNEWSVDGECWGLSQTRTSSLLVTLGDKTRIQEYRSDGHYIREISLDSSIERPQHCVQLSFERFVVSHGDYSTDQRQLSIVDKHGRIIQSYGGSKGSSVGQMKGPRDILVDKHDNILVADRFNMRIELLSPTLTHLGYIDIPRYELCSPWALHLDEENRRLYVGEWGGRGELVGGRIFVLEA